MNPGLCTAIDSLYAAFASYELRDHIESCPCCRGPKDTRALQAQSLRSLTPTDLDQYPRRAMTTIGDADDFRHFLPRILELALQNELLVDVETVLGKLAYGDWTNWPATERAAVEGFLREAWQWVRRGTDVESWLCGIACTGVKLRPYLDDWANDQTPEARASLEQFAKDYAEELSIGREPEGYWEDEVAREQWKLVSAWIRAKAVTGFLAFGWLA